jgi:hypothetical protein
MDQPQRRNEAAIQTTSFRCLFSPSRVVMHATPWHDEAPTHAHPSQRFGPGARNLKKPLTIRKSWLEHATNRALLGANTPHPTRAPCPTAYERLGLRVPASSASPAHQMTRCCIQKLCIASGRTAIPPRHPHPQSGGVMTTATTMTTTTITRPPPPPPKPKPPSECTPRGRLRTPGL